VLARRWRLWFLALMTATRKDLRTRASFCVHKNNIQFIDQNVGQEKLNATLFPMQRYRRPPRKNLLLAMTGRARSDLSRREVQTHGVSSHRLSNKASF